MAHNFYPMFSPRVSRWASGQKEKVCLGCISETVRCKKLILGRDIGRGCRCAMSWCDLDLDFIGHCNNVNVDQGHNMTNL